MWDAASLPQRAFTLVEVLAALAIMAILIPVIFQCLSIASRAGEVAQRKTLAARVGQRVLNEALLTQKNSTAAQRGTAQEGPYPFQWQIRNGTWGKDQVKELSVEVTFTVQNQDYHLQLHTLSNPSQP